MEDLRRENDVVAYMLASEGVADWNARCDAVKKANDGNYPSFWYKAIVLSGIGARKIQSMY